jgi:hypothetical protein
LFSGTLYILQITNCNRFEIGGRSFSSMSDLPKTKNDNTTMAGFTMTRHQRFWFLVSGILFFFGCHNYLQELIMSLPGFDTGVFLGYLEVLGVAVCSYAERAAQGETARRAPMSAYFMLCFCLLISSAASNIALSYINYATKVVFRSCKVRHSTCMNVDDCMHNMIHFALFRQNYTYMHTWTYIRQSLPCFIQSTDKTLSYYLSLHLSFSQYS